MSFEIRGLREVNKALDGLTGRQLNSAMQKASAAGGKALKPIVQREAPRRTGRLRRAVSSRKARRDLPGTVVSARPSIAFYRHMVIGGTRHSRANPFIDRAYDSGGEAAALKAVGDAIDKYLDSL